VYKTAVTLENCFLSATRSQTQRWPLDIGGAIIPP